MKKLLSKCKGNRLLKDKLYLIKCNFICESASKSKKYLWINTEITNKWTKNNVKLIPKSEN